MIRLYAPPISAGRTPRKEYDEWLDGYSKYRLTFEDWKNKNYGRGSKFRFKLNNQLFGGIKRIKLSKQEMATVPNALRVFANAQPKEEMYNGRKMVKEYGDYCYSFLWCDNEDEDIVIYKRRKIRAKNRGKKK